MKTTARITWALVSLGLLFHCVSNSTATPTTAPQSTKAPEAATTPIPPTTPTVPITTNVAITPQPITSAIDTTASAASAGITQPTAPAAQATAATVPAIGGGLTTQTNQDPNPGSTPSMPATATNQSVTITPANVPTVTAAVSTVAAAAVTTAAAAPSDSTDAKTTVPTQNTSPGLTGPGKGSSISATPSATTAKQGTDGTSGNVISTALTTSPVKTTPRTSNGVTLPPTTPAVTEKKVTTSPLLQSTTTAPAAVSTPSKILTPSPPPPPPPTPPTPPTVTAVETTKTISFTKGQENKKEEKELGKVCTKLMEYMNAANCTMTVRQHDGKTVFHNVQIEGTVDVTLATQYYEEITKANEKKSGDNSTLIAILASCGALLVMIVGLAIYAHHRKPYHENQQHLTEELHTVENGYHDNPTLEVMEVQPEMQEKKMALNGEFNDSWIVPIDHLLKEDLPDEEDTHL